MSTTVSLRVGNLMSIDPVTVAPDAPVAEAEALLRTYRISGLPVVDHGELIGVVSQTDLLTAHASELISANWPRLRVRHIMSRPAIAIGAMTSVEDAARRMIVDHIHRLVVTDDAGTPIGVVTPLDLLRVILDEAEVA
ncbi:MAG TPA: CBS domain-containing protein [Candidatus Limnocylindria bacterium]|nr:CBS domain-containing protein [Candidatus Limnocylindria bacterium]